MNREELHRCWAPTGGRWSDWVKPVLFAAVWEEVAHSSLGEWPDWLGRDIVAPLLGAERTAGSVNGLDDTALVIDLPGDTGAWLGVGMVEYGFRPIPLYNAVMWGESVVNLMPIINVLIDAARRVATAPLSAPPAFLLDAHRMSGAHLIRPGAFDNRSVCRGSDFPSAGALWQSGIRRAMLIQEEDERPRPDLEPILLGWQRQGIELWRKVTDDSSPATPFLLQPRAWPIRAAHAVRRAFLRRRSDGAYGTLLTEPGAG